MIVNPPEVLALAVILAAASYRITRLIVLDEVLGEQPDPDGRWRGTFIRKLIDTALYHENGDDRHALTGYLGKMYSCTFCVGFWVSLGLVSVWFAQWPWQLGVAGWVLVFAVAGGQAYLNSRHNA